MGGRFKKEDQVVYVCDSCGNGEQCFHGQVLQCSPPLYVHICSTCSVRQNLRETYPSGNVEASRSRDKKMPIDDPHRVIFLMHKFLEDIKCPTKLVWESFVGDTVVFSLEESSTRKSTQKLDTPLPHYLADIRFYKPFIDNHQVIVTIKDNRVYVSFSPNGKFMEHLKSVGITQLKEE